MPTEILIEIMVSTLLLITIFYCFLLNRKLSALKKQTGKFSDIVIQMNRATHKAEKAIQKLKTTSIESEGEIQKQIEKIREIKSEFVILSKTIKNIENNKNLEKLFQKQKINTRMNGFMSQ